MENMKEKILELTQKLIKELAKENPSKHIAILYDINDLVEELGNEKIKKKFDGIYSDLIGERNTTIDSVIEHIKHFEKSVEKNIDLMAYEEETYEEEKLKPKEQDEKPIPDNIKDIKTEMDEILGDSLFVGIEKFDFEIKELELTDETKEKIKKLQEDCEKYKLPNNTEKVEEIRKEIYMIVYPRFYPLSFLNGDKIVKLSDEQHKRLDNLLESYNKHIEQEIEKKKTKKETNKKKEEKSEDNKKMPTEEKTDNKSVEKTNKNDQRIKEIREEMAVLLYGPKMEEKAYEGIENIDVNAVNSNLDNDYDKDRFIELKNELESLKNNKGKKKGKKVVTVKSAKEFYKKHKKAILITVGLVLLAISLPHLLTSIMYLNSTLWNVAVSAGVNANAGIPVLLHDINTIIGSHIGASYAASSGIWTLANGAALNATAAEAGILISLGNIAKIAMPFVGAKMVIKNTSFVDIKNVIKNAYELAKEKIKTRKEKIEKETPEKKGHFFKDIKDYVKNKYNVVKETTVNTYNNVKTGVFNKYNEIKEGIETKKEEIEKNKKFKNTNLSSGRNRLISLMIEEDMLTEEVIEELRTIENEEEAVEILKNIINGEKRKGI